MKKARNPNQSIQNEESAKVSQEWWKVKRRQSPRSNCQRGNNQGLKSLTKSGTMMEFTITHYQYRNHQLLSEQLWWNQRDNYLITLVLETN